MNLLIDSGNTNTKVALCDSNDIIDVIQVSDLDDFKKLNHLHNPTNVIISSVNKDASEIIVAFPNSKTVILDSSTPVPIVNLYKTPSTLGMDRLAAIVGANALYPEYPCLCIDAGTCITYDSISIEKEYHGGSISPGIEMRFNALHTFTAKLPLVSRQEQSPIIGTSTETSIRSGVQVGVVKEMKGIIEEYKQLYPNLKIIITGGDAIFFESRIKDSIFVESRLVFLGLKRILEYNVL
jgi:type III pantothenate kinase